MSVIVDAEIDNFLENISAKLVHNKKYALDINYVVVDSNKINAFASQLNIGLNTGLFRQLPLSGFVSILSHEMGHIIAGHQLSRQEYIDKSMKWGLISYLAMGIGGTLAAYVKPKSGIDTLLMGGMHLSQNLTLESIYSFSRQQEQEADFIGLKLLFDAHWSGRGTLKVFEKIANMGSPYNSSKNKGVYGRTHPSSKERLQRIRDMVLSSRYYTASFPEELEYQYGMIQAKIDGMTMQTQNIINKYKVIEVYAPDEAGKSNANQIKPRHIIDVHKELYALLWADYRIGNNQAALDKVNRLLKDKPQYLFFTEAKALILDKMDKLPKSIKLMEYVVKDMSLNLHSTQNLYVTMSAMYIAKSEIAIQPDEKAKLLSMALKRLLPLVNVNRHLYDAWVLLERVYILQDDPGLTHLARANQAFINGNNKWALLQLDMAREFIEPDSTAWIQSTLLEDSILYSMS